MRHLQRAYALTELLMNSENTSPHRNKQNPFSAQMKPGFGTNKGPLDILVEKMKQHKGPMRQRSINPIDTIDRLNDEALRIIMEHLEVSKLKIASLASKKIKRVAWVNIEERLKKKVSELVTDDQNLIDAIQNRDDRRANLLLQYRTGSPAIEKSAIKNGMHDDVIRKVVEGALATERKIELALYLDPITHNTENPFIVTIGSIDIKSGVISATANEASTTQKIKEGQTLKISIVTEQGATKKNKIFTRIMYTISAPDGSLLWSSNFPGRRRRGKLTLKKLEGAP